MKTGDKVIYASDVHPEYTGQEAAAIEFDLEAGMVNLRFQDGMLLWVFGDEVMIPGRR
ncbi:hypothetical protein [Lacrimispora sp.]|uniref:hypothetical protein n=1 Tax=Lacrimispora sp. TaxID=2719234 RepID=UPI00289FDD7E|nr:hypothetical protein [Lacrimispora sp.]